MRDFSLREYLLNLIKSMKFRIFMIVALAIIVPVILAGTIIIQVAVNSYMDDRIEQFKAENAVLKNTIVSNNYFTEGDSDVVEATIDMVANEYNCHAQIVDTSNIVLLDTKNTNVGNTSVAEPVMLALQGEDQTIRDDGEHYMEFALPLISTVPDEKGNTASQIVGVLYLKYSTIEAVSFRTEVTRSVYIAEILAFIFALIISWICSIIFIRPLQRVEKNIRDVNAGVSEEYVYQKEYTEIVNIAEQFNKMIDEFNAQAKKRDEFVSNVSHELKTPITSMKVLADSLLSMEGVSSEMYEEFLKDISKEIERENEIISDLLDIVKGEREAEELNISSVSINDVIESTLKRLTPIAKEKNVEIIYEDFRPVIAEVDELKFSRVVTNLIENAIKYNNVDGKVTVSLNADHQYFFLSVADTGIGIGEEDQERVFERFFRVDKARARETGGTGLGLAITNDIVKQHYGSIGVQSKEDEGTTFTVRIPLKYIEQV